MSIPDDVAVSDNPTPDHQTLVRLAFDRVAGIMDDVLVRNPINAWMRRVNFEWIRRTFPPGFHLVELGCGTGRDALALSAEGRMVFGIDVSPEMVRRAEQKALGSGLEKATKFVCGRNEDLLELLEFSPWKNFDGAYANFALTYEESLEKIASLVSTVLAPRGRFICTLPNRTVLLEFAIYGPLLRFDKALWRFQKPLMKDVHGAKLEIQAYSPAEVRRAFGSWFVLERTAGIPTFVPPVYLHQQYARLGSFRHALERIDSALGPHFPWNRLGEHTLYVFRRRAIKPENIEGRVLDIN